MNLSRSFRNFEESRRHMPRNNPNAARAVLLHQIRNIIRPTGLGPIEFSHRYNEWLRRRRILRNHAVNRMRAAATARRTRAMRRQLSAAGLPRNMRNVIATVMRSQRR